MRAFLFGEAEDEIAATLAPSDCGALRCGTLALAFAAAHAEAAAGDTVLLSPAATSYDAFADFEARGEYFRTLVSEAICPPMKNKK